VCDGEHEAILGCHARAVTGMWLTERGWRVRDYLVWLDLSLRKMRPEHMAAIGTPVGGERRFAAVLPADTATRVPDGARAAVLEAADRLMLTQWDVNGVTTNELVRPDGLCDLAPGRRSAPDRYPFHIDHRCDDQRGDVEQVWQSSRLQHLTLLATAWFLSHKHPYAERVADQLRLWWRENPFPSDVNWTSCLEVGIRLISFVWIRRLLADWPGASDLFEDNALAIRQIYWHQRYLATFPVRRSSAGSHAIGAAVGQLVASCAFPWFAETERWRRKSARLLEREFLRHTFSSGVGRDLASDGQCFIAELGFVAAVEAGASSHPLSSALWDRLCATADSTAALVDEQLRPPRQGDCDESQALLLDAPVPNRLPSFLALADALVGGLEWWPRPSANAGSVIVGALARAKRIVANRPVRRPSRFADAGITLLRASGHDDLPEIWCRCDGGPPGHISVAARPHADALSIEVRYGGVDVLADPGTCCSHAIPSWRSYFRSTIAHNTVELGGHDQPQQGGSFTWLRHAQAREIEVIDDGDVASWAAEHDGYRKLDPPASHRRSILLDRASRIVDIVDQIEGGSYDVRLAFHFGPDVEVELDGSCTFLSWPDAVTPGAARMELPAELSWSLHRGETDPILGWYASGSGRCVAAFTLVGCGCWSAGAPLATRLKFADSAKLQKFFTPARAVSWPPSGAVRTAEREIQAEAR
jgi:Heparinase II/III-like protein/Heparinase II/III N-terminus